MWKITNNTNKEILDDFKNKLIEPLFKEVINYKDMGLNCGFKKYINENQNMKCESSKELISYVIDRKHNGIIFNDLIDNIILENSLTDIEKNYTLFKNQNDSIDKLNYNISQEDIPEGFKILFVEFFYNKFFNYEKIWELIDIDKYGDSYFNRKMFHQNFKDENNIVICPYCDIDTTISISNNEIEHFLPKSKYPYICMNANNLISSCHACNKKVEGKGDIVFMPIYTPFNLQIGDIIEIESDIINREITLKSDDESIDNYLELLKLKERYGSDTIYNLVESKAESIYDTICKIEEIKKESMTEKDIVEYIEQSYTKFARKEPLSFAVKNIYSKYELYTEYKKSR